MVGRINSKYATMSWTPILYMYRHLSFEELIALYAAADVGLVLPLRDGMNLVAKEYAAVQARGEGILVLSETAGAAKELQQAIIVNPNSKEDVAAALRQALLLPATERMARAEAMGFWLQRHDVEFWAARSSTGCARRRPSPVG